MAMAMLLDFEGVTQEEYDRINDALNLGDNPADGLILHTAGATQTGWRVFDIWESPEAFGAFAESKLGPTIAETLGDDAPPPPQPEFTELHNAECA